MMRIKLIIGLVFAVFLGVVPAQPAYALNASVAVPVVGSGNVSSIDHCATVPHWIEKQINPRYCRMAWLGYRIGKNAVIIVTIIVMFGLLYTFRAGWYPSVYNLTCRQCHCCSPRNIPYLGWCCSCFCYPCLGKYHPSFRMRVVVHETRSLRCADPIGSQKCYVVVACGNNPVKTTSVQTVSKFTAGGPCLWNEPLDLIISSIDEEVLIQVMDKNTGDEDDVMGTAKVAINDFFFKMREVVDGRKVVGNGESADNSDWPENTWGCVWGGPMWMPGELLVFKKNPLEKKLLFKGKESGRLFISLYATRLDKNLPAVLPGMDEEEALLN